MNNLNDSQIIADLDNDKMLQRISELPRQIESGWKEVQSLIIPSYYLKADKILLTGMGGSGISGALVRSLLKNVNEVPIYVHRDYGVPGFVDEKTLVIATSYSGDTEETLDSFVASYERGAKLVAICTGGRLEQLARKYKVPYYKFDYKAMPRAALGYSFAATLGILKKIGLTRDITQRDIDEAISILKSHLENYLPENNSRKNLAKKIAKDIFGSVPNIWAAGNLEEVARRWKCQINENAKNSAVFEILPELNHNTISDLDFPHPKNIHVIILKSKNYHPRVLKRIEISREILDKKEITHSLVEIENAGGPLAEILANILLGDFVSFYLAILHNVNPNTIETVEYLKERLK